MSAMQNYRMCMNAMRPAMSGFGADAGLSTATSSAQYGKTMDMLETAIKEQQQKETIRTIAISVGALAILVGVAYNVTKKK